MSLTTPNIERRWKNLPGEPVGDAGDAYTGYDRFGRTERMHWVKNPLGGTLEHLVDVQWGYNRASLKTWRKDLLAPASAGQDQHFGYDGLHQVIERQRGLLNINTTAVGGIPAQVENFSYDETGNWVSYRQNNNGELDIDENRVNNRSNQMTQVDGSSAGVSYDKNGNMVSVPTGEGLTGPSRKLVWDAWNRLRKVSDENDEVIGEYEYDGSARRTLTQAEGMTRRYYYNDQWRSLEERLNGESPAERQHVWHPVNRWEMLFRDRGGERHYPLKDQLDVVALCGSSGIVQERYDYTTFGISSVLNGDFTPKEGSTISWDFRFHAEFVDDQTGWYNYGYRYYVPTLGGWLSRDPIGIAGGLNLYAMVENNIVNLPDFLGTSQFDWIDGPISSPPPVDRPIPPPDWPLINGPYDGPDYIPPPPDSGGGLSFFLPCYDFTCKQDCIQCCSAALAATQVQLTLSLYGQISRCAALTHPVAIGACVTGVSALHIGLIIKAANDAVDCYTYCDTLP